MKKLLIAAAAAAALLIAPPAKAGEATIAKTLTVNGAGVGFTDGLFAGYQTSISKNNSIGVRGVFDVSSGLSLRSVEAVVNHAFHPLDARGAAVPYAGLSAGITRVAKVGFPRLDHTEIRTNVGAQAGIKYSLSDKTAVFIEGDFRTSGHLESGRSALFAGVSVGL